MAKNAITDYDTNPANNTDVGSIGVQGTNIPSNFDNSQREIMSHLADMNAGTSPLHDTFAVADPDDLTKKVRIDAGNVTAGQTRVINMPDEDLELVSLVGQVLYFATSAAPNGFLKANGSAISRADYDSLFSVIGTTFGAGDGSTTFNLPDLRGEFIRGWDDSRGIDSGRVFGSAQSDAIRNITGSTGAVYRAGSTGSSGAISLSAYGSSPASGGTAGADAGDNATISFDASLQVPTASENRSRNIALLACIKY